MHLRQRMSKMTSSPPRPFIFGRTPPNIPKMRSALTVRSYSFIIFGFCFLFLIFGYRSLRAASGRSDHSRRNEEYADEAGEGESLAKLYQAKCSEHHLEQVGEHNICQPKNLNKERNCLIFSVTENSDLKFESDISTQMDKCKVLVYDHEAKVTDSDSKYKVVEKMEGEVVDEKMLTRIIDTEKKGKIHLLRLEAGPRTTRLAQSKLLKERSICHLLLNISLASESKLADFVKKMRKDNKYNLYAARELEYGDGNEEKHEEEVNEDNNNNNNQYKYKGTRRRRRNSEKLYNLSFVSQSCAKSYGLK